MTSVVKMISRGARLTLLLTASWISFSCPSDNTPSTASQQPLFTNAPGSPVSVQNGSSNILIGDMNNDRKLDLAVATHDSYGVTLLTASKSLVISPPIDNRYF